MKHYFFGFSALFFLCMSCADSNKPVADDLIVLSEDKINTFWDYNIPIEARIDKLIDTLTVDEKISLMMFNSPAIERLDIPAYNWWNEALHGVARAGKATVFPQAIGLGATFDPELILEVASAISDEGRAKFNAAQKIGNTKQYMGLSYWSPNVNIFRDPRWGRGQETYGEDPFLCGIIGSSFVKGLQGDNPDYLKSSACAKHFAVHSGPELLRHEFNATPPKKDFYETYLPAFEMLVHDAKVESVMCAYNRTYDSPCCGSKFLLKEILRDQWGFKGHIVSDCWGLIDFHNSHGTTNDIVETAALALKSGVNVNCGMTYDPYLKEALGKGLVSEEMIEKELRYLMRTRFKLGLFDPLNRNPYNQIPKEVIGSPKHKELARKAASESIVLVKNDNSTLPLRKDLHDIQVVGVHGNDAQVMYGNYYGTSSDVVTITEGIANTVDLGTRIEYKQAFLLNAENANDKNWAVSVCDEADAIIIAAGISQLMEGEESESIASPYQGDRKAINLPQNQIDFIKGLREGCECAIILVVTSGSAVSLVDVEEYVDAILYVWYTGEQGGNAIADVIFGNTNPSGRLPITVPKSVDQLPDYEDYSMTGRTYKYFKGEPAYPFGYGLGFTSFSYGELKLSKSIISNNEEITALVSIKNEGEIEGEEVVQLYVSDLESKWEVPHSSLQGFQRVRIAPGETKVVQFSIGPKNLTIYDKEGNALVEPGEFQVTVAACAPGFEISKSLPSTQAILTIE